MRAEIPLVVLDAAGNPVNGASATIYLRGTATPATVYSAATGPGVLANPVITGASGRVEGWLERFAYDAVVTATGLATYTEAFETAPASDGGIDTAWIAAKAVTVAKMGSGAEIADRTPVSDGAGGVVWSTPEAADVGLILVLG